MEFALTERIGEYDLLLVLAKDDMPESPAVAARFQTVSDLSVHAFGGGFTQLLCIFVEDVSNQQWDRIAYRVYDAEREMISFHCRKVSVSPVPPDEGSGPD